MKIKCVCVCSEIIEFIFFSNKSPAHVTRTFIGNSEYFQWSFFLITNANLVLRLCNKNPEYTCFHRPRIIIWLQLDSMITIIIVSSCFVHMYSCLRVLVSEWVKQWMIRFSSSTVILRTTWHLLTRCFSTKIH